METTSAVFSTCTSQRKRLKTCRFDLFLCEVQVENTANFHEGRGRRTGNDPLSSHEMTLSGKYLWFCTFQAPIPDGFRENQLGKSAELVFQAPIPGSLSLVVRTFDSNPPQGDARGLESYTLRSFTLGFSHSSNRRRFFFDNLGSIPGVS